MLNQHRILTYCILVATSAIGLTGCGEKTTSTTQTNPDGSQTTTVTEQKGLNTKTTVTQTPASSEIDDTDSTHTKANINFSIGKGTEDGAEEVHVRGPGIKIDTAEGDGKVDINVPFVKVKKDSSGRVQVKTPFANIETNEH